LSLSFLIIEQSGFKPNREKTIYATKSEAQSVTGHLVNVKPSIKKSEKRKLWALLYKCKTQGQQECTNEQPSPDAAKRNP
jgi:hypothetical protein